MSAEEFAPKRHIDDIVKEIVKWLRQEPDTTVAGILYLQDTNNKSAIYKEHIITAFPGAQYITWWSIGHSAGGGYTFDNTNHSAWSIITAAMQESTSEGVALTRGQLASKLEEISGQSPPNGSEGNRGTFGGFKLLGFRFRM